MDHEGRNSAGSFPHVKPEQGEFSRSHGTLSLHCSSDSPVRSAFLHSGEELLCVALALLPRGIHPFLRLLSKTSESHPLNLPVAAKHPPKHAIQSDVKVNALPLIIPIFYYCAINTSKRRQQDRAGKQKIPTLGACFVCVLIKYRAKLSFHTVLASVDSGVGDAHCGAFALSVVNRVLFVQACLKSVQRMTHTRPRTHTPRISDMC